MSIAVTAALASLVVLLLTLELLRRRQLREKYAAIWLLLSLVVLGVSVFPGVLLGLSARLGFAVPANLVFLASVAVLLFVSMQLSLEVGRLEDESQRLAEEVALLRHDVDRLRRGLGVTDAAEHPAPAPEAGS